MEERRLGDEIFGESGGRVATDSSQEIGTACYLCYGQCVNFGVQGEGGRPCARGVTGFLERRRRARSGVRADHECGT